MNTDTKRSAFMIVLSSEDYMDATAKIAKLNLKHKQANPIARFWKSLNSRIRPSECWAGGGAATCSPALRTHGEDIQSVNLLSLQPCLGA